MEVDSEGTTQDVATATATDPVCETPPLQENNTDMVPESDGDGGRVPATNIASVEPVMSSSSSPCNEQETVTTSSQDEQVSDSLSLLKDTLPGFKITLSPTGAVEGESQTMEDRERSITVLQDSSDKEESGPIQNIPTLEEEQSSSESDIDEDALSIIIAVEGEDEDDLQMDIEASSVTKSVERMGRAVIDLASKNNSVEQGSKMECDNGVSVSTTTSTGIGAGPTKTAGSDNDNKAQPSKASSNAKHSKQSAKVKQFFTTLQAFGNRTSQEVAEQVQELITALVVSLSSCVNW